MLSIIPATYSLRLGPLSQSLFRIHRQFQGPLRRLSKPFSGRPTAGSSAAGATSRGAWRDGMRGECVYGNLDGPRDVVPPLIPDPIVPI